MQLTFDLVPQFKAHPFDKLAKELDEKGCVKAHRRTLRLIRKEQLIGEVHGKGH